MAPKAGGCGRLTPFVQKSLTALTSTAAPAFEPYTEWMPAEGLDDYKIVLKIKGQTGSFQATAAFQTAGVRPDSPNDWSTGGSLGWTNAGAAIWIPASGTVDTEDTATVASPTTNVFWIRFGVAYGSATSGTADVSMQVAFDSCGELVGNWQGLIQAYSTSTKVYQPVTGWIPAIHAAKVKMALISTGATAEFRYTVGWQTADYVPEAPNAWSETWTTGPTGAPYSSNAENDTGEMVATTGTSPYPGWIRFGIAAYLSSGSYGQGYVSAATAIRNS